MTRRDAGTAGIALAYIRAAHALSDPQKRVAFSAWEGHNMGAKQQQCVTSFSFSAVYSLLILTIAPRYMQYAEARLETSLAGAAEAKSTEQ